jgi:hypothetical protein
MVDVAPVNFSPRPGHGLHDILDSPALGYFPSSLNCHSDIQAWSNGEPDKDSVHPNGINASGTSHPSQHCQHQDEESQDEISHELFVAEDDWLTETLSQLPRSLRVASGTVSAILSA